MVSVALDFLANHTVEKDKMVKENTQTATHM